MIICILSNQKKTTKIQFGGSSASAIIFFQPRAGFIVNYESLDYLKARGFRDITAEAGASAER